MQQKDYYEILGISANANSKMIKEAYRALAFEYHPDRNKDNLAASEKMKQINEAYAVLSNPKKRSEYDTLKDQFGDFATGHYRQSHSQQDIFRGSDIHQVFEEMARSFGFRGVDDIFKDFYGPGYRSFEFKQRRIYGRKTGAGIFGAQPLSFQKNLSGGFLNFFSILLKQLHSGGLPQKGKDRYDTIVLSPDFAKSGGPFPYFLKKESKKLVVKVPPGIQDNQKIRLVGMGDVGKNGGEPGNLYLKIQLRKTLFQKIKNIATNLIPK